MEKVSICIPAYNSANTLGATLSNCIEQDYPNKEIIVYDDASDDETPQIAILFKGITLCRGVSNQGVGVALTEAVRRATGDIIVLLCGDDLFTDRSVVSDIAKIFDNHPKVGHISRYYHQFINNHPGAVRAWRTGNPLLQANNPSGLAFRRKAVEGKVFSNKMFVEAASMVKYVMDDGWQTSFLAYDTVAVRVHVSTSMKRGTYQKYWSGSMVKNWLGLGVGEEILKDYTTFLQIRRGGSLALAWGEIVNFARLRPRNLLNPLYWFFVLVAILSPRALLYKLPAFYKHRIGRLFTKEVSRGDFLKSWLWA